MNGQVDNLIAKLQNNIAQVVLGKDEVIRLTVVAFWRANTCFWKTCRAWAKL